jgi:diguanylate cyclase (GGDEF)-like protein
MPESWQAWRSIANVDKRPDVGAVIEAAQALSGEEDLDALLEHVATLATTSLGYDSAVVYLVDDDAQLLEPAATAGASREDSGHEAGDNAGEMKMAADEPAARAARERRVVEEAGTRAVPLLLGTEGGVLAGVLEARGTGATAGSGEALTALADLAAVAVERTRLHSALDERSEWFERLSEIDPLTGLANRRTLERAIELELMRATRQNTPLAIVMFDLVGATELNERLGHAAVDDVLRRIAAVLTENVRLIDTVARTGADEFVVVAPGATGPALAHRIVAAVEAEQLSDGTPLRLGTGRAVFPDDGGSAEELLKVAQARLRGGAE